MDEEHRCDVHGERATAFCKVHKILLCTKCFIHNEHKSEDCNISEMKDLSLTDKLVLNIKSLEYFIKEKVVVQEAEQKSLINLHEVLKKQVDACYRDLYSELGEMKVKTLDYLQRSIDRRNTALERRSDVLSESQATVLKYMKYIETESDNQDIGNINEDLEQLKTRVNDHTPAFLKPVEGEFIPLNKIFTDDVLGDFEFNDETYEDVEELNLDSTHGDQGSGIPAVSEVNNFDTVESDDYGSVAARNQSSISSHGGIECESCKPSTRCVIKKIDVLPDKRVVVLDTKHQKLLLLDHDGHVIQEFVENGKSVEMIEFCTVKDKLAVLGTDDTGKFISEVFFAKNVLKSKGKNYLVGDQFQHLLQHVVVFGLDTGILQNMYVIGFADRIVKYKAGKIENVASIDDKLVPDPTAVQSIYDFDKDVIYILDKGKGSLVRYDCKDEKTLWTFASKTESYRPLAMYNQQVKKYLLILCPGKIIRICKDSGKVLREKDNTFSEDLVSFCVHGCDVIAIHGKSGAAFRMTKYPNVLTKQRN